MAICFGGFMSLGIRSQYTEQCNFFGTNDPRKLIEQFGSPLYVYNENILRKRCKELVSLSNYRGFGVNYSVKANANPYLLKIVREEGLVVDAMSPGELAIDQMAGFSKDKILYISNNNSVEELLNAVKNCALVSVDSLSQLETFGKISPNSKVMIRLNPGVGAGHHAKVITAGKYTKFGISLDSLDEVFSLVDKYNLVLAGINQHIGSLFMDPDGYLEAAKILLDIGSKLPVNILKNIEVIDFGGGFGIPYHKYDEEKRLDMEKLGESLHSLISEWADKHGYLGRFLVEPGRYVMAECGILLGSVNATKNNGGKRYVGTDIGFNVLVRPAMYDSFHDIEIYNDISKNEKREILSQIIVGNICESGDILAKDRDLPEFFVGDVIGLLDAGAYGFSMSSSYNQRFRPAEVCITSDGKARLIRRRETIEDLCSMYQGLI